MNYSRIIVPRDVSPELAAFYDSDRMKRLARSASVDDRVELTEAVCNVLDACLSPREEELAADILANLLKKAELDMRRALAERLALKKNVPLRLALNFAHDDIEVAQPILRASPVLSDLDLIYIIKAKDAPYWRAIAQRDQMGEQVVDSLVSTHDSATVHNILQNAGVQLNASTLKKITEIAKDSDILTEPLLARPEVTEDLARELYWAASLQVRQDILNKFDIDPAVLDTEINKVSQEYVNVSAGDYVVMEDLLDIAQEMRGRGELGISAMIEALNGSQLSLFKAMFCVYSDLPENVIESALAQEKGAGLAVICRALGIQKPDFTSIFLLNRKIRHKKPTTDHMLLGKALDYYNRVNPSLALKMIEKARQHDRGF